MKFPFTLVFGWLLLTVAMNCDSKEPAPDIPDDPNTSTTDSGVYIICEGQMGHNNGSLSYYNVQTQETASHLFYRANGTTLGDVFQSMIVEGDTGYLVINNSQKVYRIDLNTYKITGKITGLTSPRYIHRAGPDKFYITDLYEPVINIVSSTTLQKTGTISTGSHTSTEQMLQIDKELFVSCWVDDNKILVIDTETDRIIDSVTVGLQPTTMVEDKNGNVWVMCNGDYSGTSGGLYVFEPKTRTIITQFDFPDNQYGHLAINGEKNTILFVRNEGNYVTGTASFFQMGIDEIILPSNPKFTINNILVYGVGIHSATDEIYIANSKDYVGDGQVYRHSFSGNPLDTFTVGTSPNSFVFDVE